MGRALLRLLISKETEMRRKYDVRWRLTGVASRRIGWVADPDGLNPISLLGGHFPNVAQPSRNVREWLERAKIDVLFEASSLNSQTGQPAMEHIVAALEYGAHDSANRPIVFAYHGLMALAGKGRCSLIHVMDGVPIFPSLGCRTELRGFSALNSATNIVRRKWKGRSSANIRRGNRWASPNRSSDLDGWDRETVAAQDGADGIPTRIDKYNAPACELSRRRSARRTVGMRYKLVAARCHATGDCRGGGITLGPIDAAHHARHSFDRCVGLAMVIQSRRRAANGAR